MPRVAHDGALNIFHISTQQVRRITLFDRFVVNARATSGADVLTDAKVRVFFFGVCLPASWHTRNIGIPCGMESASRLFNNTSKIHFADLHFAILGGRASSEKGRRTSACSNFTSISAKRLHDPRGEPRFLGDEVATGRQLQRQASDERDGLRA